MKNVIFLFTLLSIQITAQIDLNEFPKIGFADLYWLELSPFYYNGCSHNLGYANRHYYYPELEELGLNYVVTMGNPNGPLNPSHNTSIKVIDRDFGAFRWTPGCYWYAVNGYDLSAIAYSTGNDPEFYAYEAGGDGFADPSNENHKFGFGAQYDISNVWKYSFWLRDRDNTIGDPNKSDLNNSIRVFYAGVNSYNEGYILRGAFHPLHQNTYHGGQNYYLMIRARINQIQGGYPDDIVATVYFTQGQNESTLPEQPNVISNFSTDEIIPESPTPPYDIKAMDFVNGNNYLNLKIPFVKVHNGSWSTEKMYIDVKWKDTRDLYIDNISIFNKYYDSLYIQSSPIPENITNRIKSLFINNFSSRANNPLWAHAYQDEAMPLTYRCLKTVSDISELPDVLGVGKYVTGVNNSSWFTIDQMRFAYSIKRFPYVLYDQYPIAGDVDVVSVDPPPGKRTIQSAYDQLISFDYGFDPIAGEVKNGLRHSIEIANNYTLDDVTDDVPFFHTMQSCSYKKLQNGQPIEIKYREPTPNEIFAQGFLAMCYGAKGIMYFTIWTNTPNNTGDAYYGLFESEGHQGQYVQNPSATQIPNERYNAVKLLNQEIDKLSTELLSLTWKDAFSFHKLTERDRLYSYLGHYITNLTSYEMQNGTPLYDPLNESFVEIGVFKKTSEFSNNLLDYFMLVNRRGQETEGRYYNVTFNKSGSPYVNWRVYDVATGENYPGYATDEFTIYIEPGKGKLFNLQPTIIGGGSLVYDETIPEGSSIDLHGDLYIENNSILTVNGEYNCYGNIYLRNNSHIDGTGKINFYNGTQLYVTDQSVSIWGTSMSDKLILDFIDVENNSGINIQSGSLSLMRTIIINSGIGLQTERNFYSLSIDYVDFENCGNGYYSISIAGPSTIRPWIGNSTFNNCYGAILASNLNEIEIRQCDITNNDAAIYLSNIPEPYIKLNEISSTKNTMPGIFLSSCNGFIRDNIINGHTNGIHLANSSPDIGGNYIDNNLYHGIYIGAGSLPDMHAEFFADNPEDPEYYAISGYNTIMENGGNTNGGIPDNDGSEIYFGSSNANANMREGCNSIVDNRAPGGDRPPYNTRLLMNGPGNLNPITVHAESNCWSINPLYPLAQRFGNLRVFYNPILTGPCEYGSGEEILLVRASNGDVIDTVRSVEKSIGVLSNTDILYSRAEKKFVSADYDGAEQLYDQIITSEDTLFGKFLAYQRLYELGKIMSKNQEYFSNLNSTFSSLSQSTEDSLLQKRFSQLASLSLVGGEEYIPAIGEFDNIIEQNPGTEEAVYAEIDALTTALLLEPGDSTLSKTIAKKYLTNRMDYTSRINQLLQKNFGVKEEGKKEIIPNEYMLYNNYPNPFNPSTKIRFDLPERTNIELSVYNILGQEVKTIISNESREPGRYEVNFDGSSLASGLYIYKFTTPNYSKAGKMMLIK